MREVAQKQLAIMLYKDIQLVNVPSYITRNLNGIDIRDSGIEEVKNRIDFIRNAIPKKNSLTEQEIEERLKGIRYGVKVAYRGDEFIGLILWHEKSSEEAYLWLGACSEQGKGIGSMILESVLEDMKKEGYKKISAKVGKDNIIARRQLEKYGFIEINSEDDVCFMEKKLENE
ncbi:MAG: GNAT family N-acetyltransferase [Candidatus Aenigmatarchaeota archaeon]